MLNAVKIKIPKKMEVNVKDYERPRRKPRKVHISSI